MPRYSSHLICNFIALSALFILYQYTGARLTTLQLAIFLAFYIIGSIILTPDLDSKSEASRRCGLVCAPYRKIFKHRGISHHPIWGIVTRIMYVTMLVLIILWVMWLFGSRFQIEISSIFIFIILHVKEIIIACAGLVISNILHIFLDRVKG